MKDIFEEFKSVDGSLLGPFDPPRHGFMPLEDDVKRLEVEGLLAAVKASGGRFRMLCLGAAPGEWAVLAERAFRKIHGDGDYMSVSVEADLGRVVMVKDFHERHGIDTARNAVVYGAAGARMGWANFPVINSELDAGAAVAATSATGTELGRDIVLAEKTRIDRLGALGDGKPLRFRAVLSISLDAFLGMLGRVDFLQCDVQGAEMDLFDDHFDLLNVQVARCCIATHGDEIHGKLKALFVSHGWAALGDVGCRYSHDGYVIDDGVLSFENPMILKGAH